MNSTINSELIPKSYAFVFVCQKGELEGMALLLAASLRRFLRCSYELIAALPKPIEKWGMPSDTTLALLNRMGVRIEYIENQISGQQNGDLLTNKIYCLNIPTKMDKLIFVDSDILCLREFSGNDRFAIPFNAAPTFLATGRRWPQVYEAADCPMPTTVMKPLFSDDEQPPYFNSGFVAIASSLAPQLAEVWLDCFHRIDQSGVLKDNPYFREQMALAVAVIKMGLPYDVLDENYNFWVKARLLDPQKLPYFLHHTWPHPPDHNQPILKQTVRSLVNEYPEMREFVEQCRWKYYLRPDFVVAFNRMMFNRMNKAKKAKKTAN
jgi:hypothetical protein